MNDNIKYYLLGFFYADASISKYSLTISLSIKDKIFLDKIANIFGLVTKEYNSKIKEKIYKSIRLIIYGKSNLNIWKGLGLEQNKTLKTTTSNIFDNIPLQFKRDFIRGFFDGDGSIFKLKNQNSHFFSITSTNFNLLKSIKDFLQSYNVTLNLKQEKTVFRLTKKGNKSLELLYNILYYEDCFKLDRKYQIFSKVKSYIFKNYYFYKPKNNWRVRFNNIEKSFKTEEECLNYINNEKTLIS